MNNANNTTYEHQEIPNVSPTAGNSGRAGCQADDPSRAFSSSRNFQKTQVVIATPPALLNAGQAAAYLGMSVEQLRQEKKRHALFCPSVPRVVNHKRLDTPTATDRSGGRGGGGALLYHIQHLDIIVDHLMDPQIYDADMALHDWNNLKIHRRLTRRPDRGGKPGKRG